MLANPSEFQASKANPGILKESLIMREFGHILYLRESYTHLRFASSYKTSEKEMLKLHSNIVDASPDCVALWMRRTNGCKLQMRSHRNFLPRAKPRNLFQRRRQMAACPELPSDGSVVASPPFVGLIRSVWSICGFDQISRFVFAQSDQTWVISLHSRCAWVHCPLPLCFGDNRRAHCHSDR